jgi:hypothetical protein
VEHQAQHSALLFENHNKIGPFKQSRFSRGEKNKKENEEKKKEQ